MVPREAEDAVQLAMMALPLGSRQHAVITDGKGGAGRLGPEKIAVDRRCSGQDAIARGLRLEIRATAPTGLRGHGEAPVFIEGSGVDKIRDIFARGALAAGVTFGDGLGAGVVEAKRTAVEHVLKIRPDAIQVQILGLRGGVGAPFAGQQGGQGIALHHRVALAWEQRSDLPRCGRGHHVFHLHRFEDRDLLPRVNHIPDRDAPIGQRRLHRGRNRLLAFGNHCLRALVLRGHHGRTRRRQPPCPLGQRPGNRGDMGGMRPARLHQRIGQKRPQPADVRRWSLDPEFGKGAVQAGAGQAHVRARRHHLGDQRIIGRARRVPRKPVAIDAHAGTRGRVIA